MVTVILATYNRSQYLAECLDSLIQQSVRPSQIIVIDDGCTDDTKAVLAPYLDKIEYLAKKNGGKASALNLAIPLIKGKYVWIFDDDDVAFPDVLERHLATLERHPEYDFSYGTFCRATTGQNGKILPGEDVHTPYVPENRMFLTFLAGSFLAQQSMLVRTAAFKESGPYNESLVRSQDYDFLIRLLRNHRGTMISGPTFYRRSHSGDRGSAEARFAPEEANVKWHLYDKIILQRYFFELHLSEYLPKGTALLCDTDYLLAHLNRAAIMAGRGLWDNALSDLATIRRYHSVNGPLLPEIRSTCHRIFGNYFGILELFNSPDHYRRLLKVFRSLPSTMITEVARGLYYHMSTRSPEFSRTYKLRCQLLLFKLSVLAIIRSLTTRLQFRLKHITPAA